MEPQQLYATRAEPRPSLPHVDPGEGMEKSKDIEEPQNHESHHGSIQNRLNGALHRNEAIDEREENTNRRATPLTPIPSP